MLYHEDHMPNMRKDLLSSHRILTVVYMKNVIFQKKHFLDGWIMPSAIPFMIAGGSIVPW